MSRRNPKPDSPWMAAQLIGASTYSTGKACKRGHVSLRRSGGTCIECEKLVTISQRKPDGYIARRNKAGN